MELREFKRVLVQVMCLPIVALLLVAAILSYEIYSAQGTVELIERSDHRIALAELIERLVADQETGVRGYQITADTRFLAPYREAEQPLEQAVNELSGNFAPGKNPNLQNFIAEHQEWKTLFAEPIIAEVAAGHSTTDDDLNLTGRERIDAMRASLNRISGTAELRRTERINRFHAAIRNIILVFLLVAVGTGLFLALLLRDRFEVVSMGFQRSLELERRRAEQLYNSEQNLRTTLNSIGDGVITCDASGRIEGMNPVAEQLTGWSEGEAKGLPINEVFRVINEGDRQRIEDPVSKVTRLNTIVNLAGQCLLMRKDGTELPINDSGAPIPDASGQLRGVVMVFRDITDERRTRAALLANEKLAVAGRLAATIAHEIHNPLDSVANLIYLLQQGTSAEETEQFLDLAQSELARVTQISRSMLSLYRESKAPVPIDLKDVLEDLLLLMERRFQELGVEVTSEIPAHVVIEGFPAELRQVFTNLITNAAEAAGYGGTVHVRVIPKCSAGVDGAGSDGAEAAGALVEISDSGPGIPADVAEHLFQPFFTTKGERGTGLGLWVSQGIIRKHGGSLELRSRESAADHGAVAAVFLAARPSIDPGAA